MARTIAAIQQQIISIKDADPVLGTYTWSSSKVALWRLWTFVVATCMWTLEQLFDYHKNEITGIIATQKPHTLQWYVMMAKRFQYGVSLPGDSDTYTLIASDPTITVVQYAAAVELVNLVRIKVAKQAGTALSGLTTGQLTAFAAYMNRIKDAGVRLQITSGNPDSLQLAVAIYYDPLVLSSTGERLDGADSTPVLRAINQFLTTLPFNGLFVLNNLILALQHVDGVSIANVLSAQANYAATPYVPITVEYVPDAGYMVLDEAYFNLNITYTAHGPM